MVFHHGYSGGARTIRRGGRVVEGAGLENRYTPLGYRGFESRPLRHFASQKLPANWQFPTWIELEAAILCPARSGSIRESRRLRGHALDPACCPQWTRRQFGQWIIPSGVAGRSPADGVGRRNGDRRRELPNGGKVVTVLTGADNPAAPVRTEKPETASGVR